MTMFERDYNILQSTYMYMKLGFFSPDYYDPHSLMESDIMFMK